MAEDKRGIGFNTSAKSIQEAYTEIQKELAKTKTNWETMSGMFAHLIPNAQREMDESIASGSEPDANLFINAVNGFMIAKLGIELMETHLRLAEVEKCVKELKLRKK